MRLEKFLNEMFSDKKRWEQYVASEPMLSSAVRILKKIEAERYHAYIVGGAVRDIFLGKKPKDIDIATNMPMDRLGSIWKTVDIGKSRDFGIVAVNLGGFSYEIAQFREDGTYTDGRRPESVRIVQTFQTDASRRDFTMNAMGLDSDGNIIDYFDGRHDIKNKLIQTVGNPHDRFEEDKLRMLRAVRLSSRMGFMIHPDTHDAIKQNAHKIINIAPERIRDELVKMASQTGDKFADAIVMMDRVGILKVILPEIVKLKEFQETEEHHPEAYATGKGRVYDHVLAALRQNKSADPLVNLALLFHDVAKNDLTYKYQDGKHSFHGHAEAAKDLIETIAKRLKLTNDEKEAILFAALNHMKMFKSGMMKPSKIMKLVNDRNWEVLKAVSWCDDSCRLGLFDAQRFQETIDDMEAVAKKWGEKTVAGVVKIVDGKRVMELTGLKPGRLVGDIIHRVTELVVDLDSKEPVDKLILKVWKEMENG